MKVIKTEEWMKERRKRDERDERDKVARRRRRRMTRRKKNIDEEGCGERRDKQTRKNVLCKLYVCTIN